MDYCFNKCFGTKTKENATEANLSQINRVSPVIPADSNKEATIKAYQNLYSSLQKVIDELENIKSPQQFTTVEEMTNFITNIAKEYDRQMKDIKDIKQTINKITNDAKNNKTVEDLTDIKEDGKLDDVIFTVIGNLEKALKALQASKEKENKLSSELAIANNGINELKTDINKKDQQANILAQSYATGYSAPDIANIDADSGTRNNLFDVFGNQTKVYFLSKDGTKRLKGEELTKNYKKENFGSTWFYYYIEKDKKYIQLNNLNDIDNLETKNIILAHKEK